MTFEQIFSELVRAEPSRPFVTHYDEATGERNELSVRSAANWVVKTHHLLTDELGLGSGDAVYAALPQSWMSVPILLACASAGVRMTDEPAEADAGFVPAADVTTGAVPGLELFQVDAAAAARGRTGTAPSDRRDFAEAVRPHPDTWATLTLGGGPHDEFLAGRSRAENLTDAHHRATELGFGDRARVLSVRDWTGPADWLDALFAPLVVRGSLVYLTGADAATVTRRSEQERATLVLP